MTDWLDFGDQYHSGPSGRPDFREYAVVAQHGHGLPKVAGGPQARSVRRYEDKYELERDGVPAYMPCRCADCAMSHLWPSDRPPMRRTGLDARQDELGRAQENEERTRELARRERERAQNGPVAAVDILRGGNAIVMFLFFVVLVFVCCLSVRVVSDLRNELKSLRQLVKYSNSASASG